MKTIIFSAMLLLPGIGVFAQPGTVLSLKTIEHEDVDTRPSDGGLFGASVVSLGDLNNDGVEDIAVGAPRLGPIGNQGVVYVIFLNIDGSVKDTSAIGYGIGGFTGSTGFKAWFGHSLANLGDIDQDGTLEIAVGNPFNNGQSFDEGLVWILSLDTTGAVQNAVQIGEGQGGFDLALDDEESFGWSLAKVPDVDGDGVPELLVGAPYKDVGPSNSGRVYLLKLDQQGQVKESVYYDNNSNLISNGLDNNDLFGISIAATSDLDSNGIPELIVGVEGDDIAYSNNGSLWLLFLDNQLNISSLTKLHGKSPGFSSVPDSVSEIGNSVANMGDIDGDGIDDIAIGSTEGSLSPTTTDIIRILFLDRQGGIKGSTIMNAVSGSPFGQFNSPNLDFSARSLAVLSDLNGDGRRDLISTAPYYDTAHGQIHILTLDGIDHTSTRSEIKLKRNNISVYPNPSTSSSFNIEFPKSWAGQTCSVKCMDNAGRKIFEQKISVHGNLVQRLEIESAAPGLYHIRVENEGEVFAVNVVVAAQ